MIINHQNRLGPSMAHQTYYNFAMAGQLSDVGALFIIRRLPPEIKRSRGWLGSRVARM